MKYIYNILFFCTLFQLVYSQNEVIKIKCSTLKDFEIQHNIWVAEMELLDTIFYPDRMPNPTLLPIEAYRKHEQKFYELNIKWRTFEVDTLKRQLILKGCITEGWYGSESNVLIMAGLRNDTVKKYINLSHHCRKELTPQKSDCIRIVSTDFCWSNSCLNKESNFRSFDCILNYGLNDNVLMFGLNNCYAIIYDLREIIKVSRTCTPVGADL